MVGAISLLTFPDLGVVAAAASNIGSAGLDPVARRIADVFVVRRRGP
jgi:hypothetical protein